MMCEPLVQEAAGELVLVVDGDSGDPIEVEIGIAGPAHRRQVVVGGLKHCRQVTETVSGFLILPGSPGSHST